MHQTHDAIRIHSTARLLGVVSIPTFETPQPPLTFVIQSRCSLTDFEALSALEARRSMSCASVMCAHSLTPVLSAHGLQ
jgi:hypothetical protein